MSICAVAHIPADVSFRDVYRYLNARYEDVGIVWKTDSDNGIYCFAEFSFFYRGETFVFTVHEPDSGPFGPWRYVSAHLCRSDDGLRARQQSYIEEIVKTFGGLFQPIDTEENHRLFDGEFSQAYGIPWSYKKAVIDENYGAIDRAEHELEEEEAGK